MWQLLAHDLIWIENDSLVAENIPSWVAQCWHPGLPLVVRRCASHGGRVPVGIRGHNRKDRFACFVDKKYITKVVRPDELKIKLFDPMLDGNELFEAARTLVNTDHQFKWGLTGSCGFTLAVGKLYTSKSSDLDLVIRVPERALRKDFEGWFKQTEQLSVRADTQIDTGIGGFSLKEWMRSGTVLLKTDFGPFLTKDPWSKQWP